MNLAGSKREINNQQKDNRGEFINGFSAWSIFIC